MFLQFGLPLFFAFAQGGPRRCPPAPACALVMQRGLEISECLAHFVGEGRAACPSRDCAARPGRGIASGNTGRAAVHGSSATM